MTKRLDNETYVDYIKRLANLKRDGKLGYDELGDLLMGSDNVYSSENIRKFWYIFDKIVNNLESDYSITDNQLIKELEYQKDEIFKERVRLRDKQREINKVLYQQSRFENLKEVVIDTIKSLPPILMRKSVDYECSDVQAALLISDTHMGLKIDNQFNFFDLEVAKDRLNQLVDKTIYYCKLHRVKTLNVELLGDIVNGIINVSNRVEQEEDIITQIIIAGDILTKVIKDLNEAIPEVKVWCVYGNHSRVIPNKKDNLNRENFERLIYHHIKTRLPDIKIVTSLNDDFLTYSINDKKIVLTHGDKDNINTAVMNFVRILNTKVDEIHMGHYHEFQCKDDNDTDIVVNGSLVSTDDYAVSIRKSTRPTQVLRVYDLDTCTYKIKLK